MFANVLCGQAKLGTCRAFGVGAVSEDYLALGQKNLVVRAGY